MWNAYGKYLLFATLGSYVAWLVARVFKFPWRVILADFWRRMSRDQNWSLLILRFPLWFEKSVMMWNRTFCKHIFPFVMVIFWTVSCGQRQTYNCHSSFEKKYFTLFHIITPFIFSQIRKLNFDSCWCFDMFYYPTFFIHQNVRTDLTYRWVQFKLNHLVFNL